MDTRNGYPGYPQPQLQRQPTVQTRSLTTSAFPGLNNPYSPIDIGGSELPMPYNPQIPGAAGGGGASAGGGLLGKLPLNDIKGVIDKMGGIDGIMSTIAKVQKMVQTFQQFTPMVKLLLASFGKAKTTHSEDAEPVKAGRKRRRKRRRRTVRRSGRPIKVQSRRK